MMYLRSMIFILFLCCAIEVLRAAELGRNFQDLKTMLRESIPLRADGKIKIPLHIKHIKLDIGLSYSAPIAQYWLSHEDDLLVFGFEPNPASVVSILHGAIKQQVSHGEPLDVKFIGKNFFLIPCALGLAESDCVTFFVTAGDCGCSSIYAPKLFVVERVIKVPIFSLAKFFDLFPFDSHPVIEYIKIDAQGSDLDIAKSAGHYLAERVIYITLEAENSEYTDTVNSFRDIDEYMRSIGFIPYISDDTTDPTYFNPRFVEYITNHDVRIYQK